MRFLDILEIVVWVVKLMFTNLILQQNCENFSHFIPQVDGGRGQSENSENADSVCLYRDLQ